MKCKQCKANIADSSIFCPMCGVACEENGTGARPQATTVEDIQKSPQLQHEVQNVMRQASDMLYGTNMVQTNAPVNPFDAKGRPVQQAASTVTPAAANSVQQGNATLQGRPQPGVNPAYGAVMNTTTTAWQAPPPGAQQAPVGGAAGAAGQPGAQTGYTQQAAAQAYQPAAPAQPVYAQPAPAIQPVWQPAHSPLQMNPDAAEAFEKRRAKTARTAAIWCFVAGALGLVFTVFQGVFPFGILMAYETSFTTDASLNFMVNAFSFTWLLSFVGFILLILAGALAVGKRAKPFLGRICSGILGFHFLFTLFACLAAMDAIDMYYRRIENTFWFFLGGTFIALLLVLIFVSVAVRQLVKLKDLSNPVFIPTPGMPYMPPNGYSTPPPSNMPVPPPAQGANTTGGYPYGNLFQNK